MFTPLPASRPAVRPTSSARDPVAALDPAAPVVADFGADSGADCGGGVVVVEAGFAAGRDWATLADRCRNPSTMRAPAATVEDFSRGTDSLKSLPSHTNPMTNASTPMMIRVLLSSEITGCTA